MARKKSTDDAGAPGFEDSLAELEDIVTAMEEEQLPLEDLVSRYEKGVHLLDRCQKILASAKEKLRTIQPGDSPENPLTPAESASTGPANDDSDDDIRLF
ncbi:MAG: exodeoxyribonuclease VII small subunit [Akkermansiaceae bacterium]|jgi:exodeoxyribonuclease VII small subunit|nr:exodeoxyribonuclease VII small subunit [Akkermansiaceae bacterium]